jgi:predicted Zn-dependent protease
MKLFPVFLLLFLRVLCAPAAQPGSARNSSAVPDLADALARMDAAARAAGELSPQDEYYLGRAVGADILSRYRPWPENPGLTAYLNKICAAITVNSPKPAIYNGYHVIILDSPELNAFATPGGHIFICRALAEAVDSEDALAALIAHEVAHIQLGHSIEIINTVQLIRDLSETASRAAAAAAREASLPDRLLLFDNSVRQIADTLTVNGYSQAQEFDADSYALFLLAGAGYAPSSLVDILKILEQSRRPGGLNATHPPPALRIAHVQELLPMYQVRDTRSFRTDRYRVWRRQGNKS